MAKARKGAELAAQTQEVVLTTFKGFDKDLSCRGFKYEIGKTYEHIGKVAACEGGFHACEYPLHVLRYYKPGTSRFAVVEQSGTISKHDEDSKVASSRITVKAEIDLAGIVKAAIKYTMDRCTPADGAHTDKPNSSVTANGYASASTANGYASASTANGYDSASTANGDASASTANGDYSASTANGLKSVACSAGRYGKASGKEGCALFLVYRDCAWNIVHAKAAIVGRDGIKPDTFYSLNAAGEFVEA